MGSTDYKRTDSYATPPVAGRLGQKQVRVVGTPAGGSGRSLGKVGMEQRPEELGVGHAAAESSISTEALRPDV